MIAHRNVMIDLEMLSLRPNAAILSIGAVEFFPKQGQLGSEFYRAIDLNSSIANGGHVDGDTFYWWMCQEAAARQAIVSNLQPIEQVLAALNSFIGNTPVWGFAYVDNAILKSAYANANIEQKWHYLNNMCYETLSSLYPQVKSVKHGTEHNALDDAIAQAKHLNAIFEYMSTNTFSFG